MHIVRLVIDNNRVVGEERLLASEGQRFRDITQGPDGALYAITDGEDCIELTDDRLRRSDAGHRAVRRIGG